MTAVSDADRLVNRLKNTNMEKFRTMCNMHLSFLLDMPGSDLEEFMAEPPSPAPSEKAKRTFFGSRRKISKGEKMDIGLFTAPLSMETIEQIHPLIEFLCKEESLKQEGIFRKAGQLNRQKVLRDKLNSGESVSVDLEQGGYSAHDCANLLKAYLAELPEPLLMEKYYKAFNQIPAMTKPGCSQEQKHLSEGKKLQTLQLLIQLLPKENFKLFECLIGILHNVHLYREHNKMSAEALGTLLAPCVLIHKKMSGNELQAAASNISKIMTFMIENSTEVLTVPQALVQDIRQYWEDMEEISENRPGSAKSEDEPDCRARFRRRLAPSDAVQTTVSFVDRIGSQEMDSEDLTQRELAKLYASVGQMAESAKKSKLVKKLNKRDGGLTPCDQSYVKHKRSKSLGESIRKMVGRNHKRRGSGHSTQVLSVMSSGQSTSSTESTSLPGHTPVIKRMSQACNTPPPTTPVMRLFNKTDLQQPIANMMTPGSRKPMAVIQSPQ